MDGFYLYMTTKLANPAYTPEVMCHNIIGFYLYMTTKLANAAYTPDVLQKGCTRLAAASGKVYPLLSHGRWFSPDTLASSTTKTSRHDIAEILLKVALKHQISIKSITPEIMCHDVITTTHMID